MTSVRSAPSDHPPGLLSVEVTPHCERACAHCYNAWAAGAPVPAELPAPELVALVRDVLRQSGLTAVQISGGEPLLRPDLLQILEGLRPYVRGLSLVTDGALLDDARVADLKRLRVGPVQPTLLAADRATHDRLKGAACFDATVDAILRLLAAGVRTSVAFVCTRQNAALFRDVVELCFALGVRHVAFARFCTAGAGALHDADLRPSAAQVATCLDVAEQAAVRLGVTVHVAISLPLCAAPPERHPHLTFGRCAVSGGNPGFTLDPQGRLRACSISPTVLGDLRTESWATVMERARAGYLARMAEVPSECRGCACVERCGGGCRESALAAFGDLDRADPLATLPRG